MIAPWREWDLLSRTKLISYAEKNKIPVPAAKRGEPPYSMDANLLHISYEGCVALGDQLAAPSGRAASQDVCTDKAPPASRNTRVAACDCPKYISASVLAILKLTTTPHTQARASSLHEQDVIRCRLPVQLARNQGTFRCVRHSALHHSCRH